MYKLSIRDYSRRLFCNIKWCRLRCNPSYLYSSTDTGLFTRFMPTKYHHFVCSVCLPICLLCSCDCMCERTTHARIQEFLPGGSRPDCQKTVLTCLFLFVFFSPQLISQFLKRVSNGYFKENYNYPWFQRGVGNICQGVQFFPGGGGGRGVQMLISIGTHIT